LSKQESIDDFWKIQQGATYISTRAPTATATAIGAPPEERFRSKESRMNSLMQVLTPLCELASNTFSATSALEKYFRRKVKELSGKEIEHLIPNPDLLGKIQNQKRFVNRAGPGSKANNRQGKETLKKQQQKNRNDCKDRNKQQFG
jgi:hypothetical protein